MDHRQSWKGLSVYGDFLRTGSCKSNNNSKNNRDPKYYRKYVNLLSIAALFFGSLPVKAADVGGVNATANPIASSSGSVTNQAIQVLQGPYLTNTYGGGIQCQGPTFNLTPFATRTGSYQLPYEDYYNDPVFDNSDLNEDGLIDNPGKVLYYRPVRTGQKNNHNWNVGFSATISFPLDGGLQARCKQAVETQIALQEQQLANRRLDFEIARLKNCGELAKNGITFHPKSSYFKICSDVVVRLPNETVAPHVHSISLKQPATHAQPDSAHAGPEHVH